jgi:hypothetical protein
LPSFDEFVEEFRRLGIAAIAMTAILIGLAVGVSLTQGSREQLASVYESLGGLCLAAGIVKAHVARAAKVLPAALLILLGAFIVTIARDQTSGPVANGISCFVVVGLGFCYIIAANGYRRARANKPTAAFSPRDFPVFEAIGLLLLGYAFAIKIADAL